MIINLKWIFKVKLDEHGRVLKKYGLDQCNPADIPILGRLKLDEDPNGTPVDPTCYRGKAYRKALNYGFRCLKGTINMGLWYPKDTEFDLTAFTNADHAVFLDSRKNTSGRTNCCQIPFIKEQVKNESVELYFVKPAYQLADIFTKALARERFEFLVKCLSMQSITPEELKLLAESDEDKE
nr:uncharacterized mitochondrial protein AtMg00810-like [Tanacetum cinerariifolium]